MKIKKMTTELRAWSEDLGLITSESSVPDLDYIISIGSKFDDLGFSEMDEVIDKVSAYLVYVAAQKSSVESTLNLLSRAFDHQLHTSTEKLIDGKKYRTYDERRALAINMSGDLQVKEARVAKLRAQYDRLKDIPRVIESRLIVLRRIYDRRVNEDRSQQE